MVRFFYVKSRVKYTKMLCFFLIAEALTGLIYHRPPGENSSFRFHSLSDDGRSISRNVANINKLVQDKTKLFFQNILQHDKHHSNYTIHLLDRTETSIIFIWSGKVILGEAKPSPNITLPDQINMILGEVLSN